MKNKILPNFIRLGVRQKVLLVLLSVLLTALSISGWFALKQEKQDTLKEINQRGNDISRFVAKSLAYSVVGYDYHTIQLLLDEITMAEDIGYARVINTKGKAMAESGAFDDSDSKMVMFVQDIFLEKDMVGKLTLGLDTKKTLQRLESQKFSLVRREALIIILIAFGEFLALSFLIIRPVSIMSKSLDSSIDENGRIIGTVPIVSKDEFGQLALQFNHLGTQLNEANARLQSRVEIADEELIKSNRMLMMQSEELKRISEEFKKLSITDPLTGLFNRRRFKELMETEIEMSIRHGDTNSLLIIDIDYFKKINDIYGHPGGDEVLKDISLMIKANLRKTDILCRIGGEEFAVLCKRADKAAALGIGEKLRCAVQKNILRVGEAEISVTISVGVATFDDQSADISSAGLYQRADKAVYASKEMGRNRVTHFDDLDPAAGNHEEKSLANT